MADIEEGAKGYPVTPPKKPVAAYDAHVAERAKEGLTPLPLNAKQAQEDPIGLKAPSKDGDVKDILAAHAPAPWDPKKDTLAPGAKPDHDKLLKDLGDAEAKAPRDPMPLSMQQLDPLPMAQSVPNEPFAAHRTFANSEEYALWDFEIEALGITEVLEDLAWRQHNFYVLDGEGRDVDLDHAGHPRNDAPGALVFPLEMFLVRAPWQDTEVEIRIAVAASLRDVPKRVPSGKDVEAIWAGSPAPSTEPTQPPAAAASDLVHMTSSKMSIGSGTLKHMTSSTMSIGSGPLSACTYKLGVHDTTYKDMKCRIRRNASIADMRRKLAQRLNAPIEDIAVAYEGRTCADDMPLKALEPRRFRNAQPVALVCYVANRLAAPPPPVIFVPQPPPPPPPDPFAIRMCGRCGQPVDNRACNDLQEHNDNNCNHCRRCNWFEPRFDEWPLYDAQKQRRLELSFEAGLAVC